MGTITNLTLRFDLEKDRDREVWERLHSDYKEKYKTCNNAVLEILKEHIASDDTSENISRKLSESVKNAIRDEFSRIISPSPPVQAVHDTVIHKPDISSIFDNDIMGG